MRCWIKSEHNTVVIICIMLMVLPCIGNTPSVVWLHVCFMESFTHRILIRVRSFVPSLLKVKIRVCVALKRTGH